MDLPVTDHPFLATTAIPVTVIEGDGIGPEVIRAALRIAEAAGARLAIETMQAGARAFAGGVASGVPRETIDSIARTGLVLKGPLETPIGHGGKSANVTLRKLFETYANIRPVAELPGIAGPYAGRGIDFVVVRENVEDLYAGIEHMQTPNVAQCLKLVSRQGCGRIARLALELARAQGRRSVHCATKANIMKVTEGMMQRAFQEVAVDFPEIRAEHILVDNCAHRMVVSPERFEVIVTTNMNGDILSDLAAGLVGGLGIAPSANVGAEVAMFEPVHGSAPDIAGQGLANPIAMIQATAMLLAHVGQTDAADAMRAALDVTLAEGRVRTVDVAVPGQDPVGTAAFADAVIANLRPASTTPTATGLAFSHRSLPVARPASRRVAGVDVFVESALPAHSLGDRLTALAAVTGFALKMISNRGTQVFPHAGGHPDCVDHWRCRFVLRAGQGDADDAQILDLVGRIATAARWMHVEKLTELDGTAGWTRAQGEAV